MNFLGRSPPQTVRTENEARVTPVKWFPDRSLILLFQRPAPGLAMSVFYPGGTGTASVNPTLETSPEPSGDAEAEGQRNPSIIFHRQLSTGSTIGCRRQARR
jgi:hypothetical protein